MNKLVTLFLLAVGLSGSTVAFADSTSDHGVLSFDVSGDYYSQLLEMFDSGQPATFADVEGWRSGRCYFHTRPDKPEGALLVGERRQVPGDHGPLFPPVFKDRVLGLVNYLETNYFDSLDQKKENEASKLVDSTFNLVSDPVEKDGALYSSIESMGAEYQVRKSDEYLVVKIVSTKDTKDLKAGTVVRACYYFKKVK